jgi:uncharacterized protein YndB with AHSA1/START domain
MPDQTKLAVRKEITVEAPVDVAFRVFTEQMATWWPLASHSVYGADAQKVEMECRLDGRIFEVDESGNENDWGLVTSWEPPHAVAFTWHPASDADKQTHVEVRFAAAGDQTLVTLVHTGWEVLGDLAQQAVKGYTTGWDVVLARYIEAAGKSAA